MSLIAGIDGCRAGWFVVSADAGLNSVSWFVASNIGRAAKTLRGHSGVGIDIPIGIPDAGARDCDIEARKLLSPLRGSSVFPAPIRPVLKCRSHAEASGIRERIDGKRISAQAFNILRKIDDVDEYLRGADDGSPQFFEVHPELAFATLNDSAPMARAKRTAEGHAERLAILAGFIDDRVIDDALKSYARSLVSKDDVLDAFAVLLAARRIVEGEARRLPAKQQFDSAGLDMAIWF